MALLVTDDEEIGSPASRPLIEELASGARAVLVLEGAAGGDAGGMKAARRGFSMYDIEVVGRQAHAGMNPDDAINALLEMAHLVTAVAELGEPARGTRVSPTVARAGSAVNTIPGSARMAVDVRVTTIDEQTRVDEAVRALAPVHPGATYRIDGGPNRPPMTEQDSLSVSTEAQAAAESIGMDPLTGIPVRGGSDASYVAALGVPVLDGLGGVGGGGHQEDEWLDVERVEERIELLAALIERLQVT